MRRILIILGHPNTTSFNAGLAEVYRAAAARAGAEVRALRLTELSFDPYLHTGYQTEQTLEPDLKRAQAALLWAEHIVLVYPTWWGTAPALLKAFLDRVLLPGFAFKYHQKGRFWDKLLQGRSARIINTMDTPVWFYRFRYGRPGHKAMKTMTLEYCGVKPVHITSIGSVRFLGEVQRERWLRRVAKLAVQDVGRRNRSEPGGAHAPEVKA